MYRHVIPPNISDNGDFFDGAIKKRNLYEAVALFIIGIIIIKFVLFAVPFMYRAIIFVFCPCLITLVALFGIGDQSLFEAIGTYIRYKKMKDILPYKIHTDNEIKTLSEKEMKILKRKEKRAQKRKLRNKRI